MSIENELSIKQLNILHTVHQFQSIHQSPPTVREVGSATDTNSTSVVIYNLDKLKDKGLITRTPEISRSTVVTKKGLREILPAEEFLHKSKQAEPSIE